MEANFKYRKFLCPICGQSTLTLRSDPVTQAIVDRANKLFPLDKFKNLTRDDTIELLTNELKAAQNHEMDQDMKNDLDKVYILRRSLQVMLGPFTHLICPETFKLIEIDPNYHKEKFVHLTSGLLEQNQKNLEDHISKSKGKPKHELNLVPQIVYRGKQLEITAEVEGPAGDKEIDLTAEKKAVEIDLENDESCNQGPPGKVRKRRVDKERRKRRRERRALEMQK